MFYQVTIHPHGVESFHLPHSSTSKVSTNRDSPKGLHTLKQTTPWYFNSYSASPLVSLRTQRCQINEPRYRTHGCQCQGVTLTNEHLFSDLLLLREWQWLSDAHVPSHSVETSQAWCHGRPPYIMKSTPTLNEWKSCGGESHNIREDTHTSDKVFSVCLPLLLCNANKGSGILTRCNETRS